MKSQMPHSFGMAKLSMKQFFVASGVNQQSKIRLDLLSDNTDGRSQKKPLVTDVVGLYEERRDIKSGLVQKWRKNTGSEARGFQRPVESKVVLDKDQNLLNKNPTSRQKNSIFHKELRDCSSSSKTRRSQKDLIYISLTCLCRRGGLNGGFTSTAKW